MLTMCPKCKSEFENLNKWGIIKFCSRSCANSRVQSDDIRNKKRIKLQGKLLTDSQKQESRLRGDNHPKRRGRNLPPVTYTDKNCKCCDTLFKTARLTSKYCSKHCYQTYKRDRRSARQQYVIESQFRFNIFNYPDEFDLKLLDTHGIYSASNKGNNLNGVSRDHMISVSYGFDNNIPPDVIGHPANCMLMLHYKNSSKHISCSITIDELMHRIEKWNTTYCN